MSGGGTADLNVIAPARSARYRSTDLWTLALGYPHLHAPLFVPPETFKRGRLTRAEQTLDRR